MSELTLKLIEIINKCFLPKLARGVDECETHAEYEIRINKLSQFARQIIELLGQVDFKSIEDTFYEVLARLVILQKDLQSDAPWSTGKCKHISNKLNRTFDLQCGTTLDKILFNPELFNVQIIFDMSMKILHENMNYDTFKKYPALIQAYYSIVSNIQEYNMVIIPGKVLPLSLLLIDDYSNVNRLKGLQCCSSILECLNTDNFKNGNYYEVIYASLMKVVLEKDLKVTKSVLKCTLQLIKILPATVKVDKTDEFYGNILEQLITESNLHRKVVLLETLKQVTELHKINCVKHSTFKHIICDSLDACSNDGVAEILLKVVLECFQEWLKYCWCVWRLPPDQQIITSLFKTLYVCKKDHIPQVQKLIIALIKLCSEEEQKQININLEEPNIVNEEFLNRIALIKKEIT